jgi:hypothetical protein
MEDVTFVGDIKFAGDPMVFDDDDKATKTVEVKGE